MEKRISITVTALLTIACVALSCGDDIVDGFTPFDIYGRVVYRPPFIGSFAEFYLYHDGEPVTDALITVGSDSIPLVNSSLGYYSKMMTVEIGDTLEYSIESQFGSSSGILVIPDTTEIVSPVRYDTLHFGTSTTVVWLEEISADGYFVYLDDQDGFVAAVTETRIDTSAVLPGSEIVNGGNKNLWVEVLRGDVIRATTPAGRTLPYGVFASAGNYREVYISLSR